MSLNQLPDRVHVEVPLVYKTEREPVTVVDPVSPERERKGVHAASRSTVQAMVMVMVLFTHGDGVDCAIQLDTLALAMNMG